MGIGAVAYREEEVTNIVSNVYCNTHICKVKAVTQPDQRQRDDVMSD